MISVIILHNGIAGAGQPLKTIDRSVEPLRPLSMSSVRGSEVQLVRDGAALALVRQLFEEYAAEYGGPDLRADGFEEELANLPGPYGPPLGRLFLAMRDDDAVGCVALRNVTPGVAEVKRLFVRKLYRGTGIGGALVDALISEARSMELNRLVLDTLPSMRAAQRTYVARGFVETHPYHALLVQGTLYFTLSL